MTKVMATPDDLSFLSQMFRRVAEEERQMIAQITSRVTDLQKEWEGMATMEFYKEYEQCISNMQQNAQSFEDIAQELDRIKSMLNQYFNS
jgi:WXG100 family type VII secretion target